MSVGVLTRYREFLPINNRTPMITLGEGETPLVRSSRIGAELGCNELYFKLEGCNPTGSFKDRGMVVAVAKAKETECNTIMCASTGNTSASAAAYGARFGLQTIVMVPKGDVAIGKLAQALAYGAKVLAISGSFDQALYLARVFSKKHSIALVNSVNPNRIHGQKTAAFELVDSLGDAPDILCIPVGNAGNITAYWKGFVEYCVAGYSTKKPKMAGFQAEGASPIVKGHIIEMPTTVASAIRIGNPASWESALSASRESGGAIDSVSDDQILSAYRMLATKEGIFCEPASAASLAGLIKMKEQGVDLTEKRAVCVITGTGLKDPELATSLASTSILEIGPNLAEIESVLGDLLETMEGVSDRSTES